MPSTLPVIDNKGSIEYMLGRAREGQVTILPCGTISEKMEGKQLSEMYDMHTAGAIAFTDDKQHVSTALMTRALEYTKNFGGLVMSFPHDNGLSENGQMHEGTSNVSLGMKGIPHVSEEIRLQRDIDILRYTGGRLHVSLISTARSVELVRKAKKEGLNVTCAIAAHQLSFLDEDLRQFDTNLKILPPFRTPEDRKALITGLKDGTIDAICSDHSPEDIEHKDREFEDAQFGISSIETAFSTAYTALEKHLSLEDIISKFTVGPARVLGIPYNTIMEGSDDFTVFSVEEHRVISEADWISKSKNTPFFDKSLKGVVYS